MQRFQTRDTIKARMIRQAARLWGYAENQMDTAAFDPLVDLLMGALATESERIYQELSASEGRILERLVQVLLPEVYTGPRPAHSVIAVQPIEQTSIVEREDSFSVRHPQTGDELKLSAAGSYAIVNARVGMLAAGNQLIRIDESQNRLPLAQTPPHRRLPENTLWLGLEIPAGLPDTAALRFYFDWKNSPKDEQYQQWMSQSKWFAVKPSPDGSAPTEFPLLMQPGLTSLSIPPASSHLYELEMHIQRYYRSQFLTVTTDKASWPFSFGLGGVPQVLSETFDSGILQSFPVQLWLRVVVPPAFTTDALTSTTCVLNAFPVVNRELLKANFSLDGTLPVFPLQVEHPLLEIASVTDSLGSVYRPYTEVDDPTAPSFAIRQQGMGRFDQRQAEELMANLLDLVRDDSAAFTAFGYDAFRSHADDIHKSLQKLRQLLPGQSSGEAVSYVVANNTPAAGTLFVQYWSTRAEKANRVPFGSRVESLTPSFRREGLSLLQPLNGGRPRLSPADRLPAFRQALLTRGRGLTVEDIRAVVMATAPQIIEKVEVQKGVMVGTDPRQGLIRTLDVCIFFKTETNILQQEQQDLVREVKARLAGHWSGVLPLRIIPMTP